MFESAMKDKTTRIKTFPNFAELVHLYQSEKYTPEPYIKKDIRLN
jgi:hypothetical protein